MSTRHEGGNIQNELTLEEHIGELNAKRVGLVSAATVFAVVNTASTGVQTVTPVGLTTLAPSPNFIGLISVAQPINSLATLYSSPNFIGLVSVAQPISTTFSGNMTLNPSPNFVGLVSVAQPLNSLATLLQSPNFIGLVTVHHGTGLVTLAPSPNFIGLISIAQPISTTLSGNVTLNPSPNFIGLATVWHGSNVTLNSSSAFIGLATVVPGSNITLNPSAAFVGLATVIPTFISGYTSLSTVISSTGPATIVVPPNGQSIFVKNLFVSSLGRSEISAWAVSGSATSNRVPWTALSTTSGFIDFHGDNGTQWGAANDGLTFVLNGAATCAVRAVVRFA